MHLLSNGFVAALAATISIAIPATAYATPACPAMTWTTLGTAGGPVPTPQRSEPANLLDADGQLILVDAGDGAVDQLAKLGINVGEIHTAFISHHHLDHTAGLSAVIGLRWMNNFPGVLTVYGPPGTRELVDGLLTSYAPQARIGFGVGKLPPPPKDSVRVIEIRNGDTVKLGKITVTARKNTHFAHPGPQQANPPQSLSYRFDFDGRSVTFTGDTGPSDAVTALARGSDLLVSEVIDADRLIAFIHHDRPNMSPQMMAGLREHLVTQHLPASEVGAMAASAHVGHVVLTHLAIPPGPIANEAAVLRAGVREHYAGPVDVARDLESFDVPCTKGAHP